MLKTCKILILYYFFQKIVVKLAILDKLLYELSKKIVYITI